MNFNIDLNHIYNKKMNITAEQVQKKSSGSAILEHEIKMILKTFQSQINESAKNGATRVVVPVPTNFNVINMNNKAAQTIIYYRLIEELKDKGFVVKISGNESQLTFCIRWDLPHDNVNLTQMRNVIASHLVKKNEPKKKL